jgi:Ser/Thr protein kinase RdoA (MazF antagonist)
MEFQSLPWREQKSRILPLAASLCIDRYGLTLKGIDKGTGEGNDFSYRVDAWEGRYHIRVCSPAYPYNLVRSTLWYPSQLKRALGLIVPETIPGVDGEPIQRIAADSAYGGYHCCVMYRWIEACLLAELREDPRFPSMMENLGAQLARMHSHSQQEDLPEWFTLLERGTSALDQWLNRLKTEPVQELDPDFDSHEHHTVGQLIAWAEELRAWMVERGEGPDQFGIIHGDFNCDNLLFQDTEPCVIDFTPLCYGYFDMDLVKALDFGVPPKNHSDFLSGYTSIRSLPDDFEDGLRILQRTRASVPNWF